MRSYIDRAINFIEQVYPFIKDDMTNPYALDRKLHLFNAQYSRKVQHFHGCARIALLTSDYVVKFDYDKDEVECLGGCEDEVRVYAQAERDGFAYLFAKLTPYEYKGHTFYIMPRVRGIGSSRYRAWHYMTCEERKWCLKHRISDLHCNNFGFRNGNLCIVDYACNGYDSGNSMDSDYFS